MAKYLFVVPPFFGHISPTFSVGAALLARGHEITWVGICPVDEKQVPPGGRFLVPDEAGREHKEAIARMLARQDDGPSLSGPEVMKLALEETYVPLARFMIKGLLRIIDQWQPDVIVNDCITFAGGLCAYLRGIPCVTTTPVPPDVMGDTRNSAPKIFEWQERLIRGLQHEAGIDTDEIVIHSRRMNLVFTSAAFAGFPEPPSHMQFVGPVKGRPNAVPFDWERLHRTRGPKVFVSLGTLLVDIRKAFFEKLTEALGNEPLTVVAATDPAALSHWPENFIVQGFVPQAEIIPLMDAVICHGGFNTVNDSLMNGLPILITPIAYDHFHTARLIENAGCGIQLRYKRLRVPELRTRLWELLTDDRYRQAAQHINGTFLRAGGTEKAVECLESILAASPASA